MIHRLKDWDDNATPSGNSVAIEVLLKLTVLTAESDFEEEAARILRILAPVMEKHPYGFARVLCALDFYLSTPKAIVIAGDLREEAAKALRQAVYAQYIPNKMVLLAEPENTGERYSSLFEGKTPVDGKPTAYVCENYACKAPVTSPEELRAILRNTGG